MEVKIERNSGVQKSCLLVLEWTCCEVGVSERNSQMSTNDRRMEGLRGAVEGWPGQ
jgi:hypothetical protein